METNKLILGDNLEILKTFKGDSVDLIYLDPPFFSNRHYEVIWGDKGEIRSFEDRWSGGIEQYIAWLKERVAAMHRILKPTGSLFLHCDWHANAYIRVNILDKIFGMQNFRNEIIWCYTGPSNSKKNFPKKHDNIFRYTKSDQWIFNADPIRTTYKASFTAARGVHGKKDYEQQRQLERHEQGKLPEDWWIDMSNVSAWRNELIGYPTQKPEALLERIIRCASNEGDLVLDPFMGGGTTIAVAERLKRRWIGIDQSVQAIKVTEFRLQKQAELYSSPYTVQLHNYEYDSLRNSDSFEFERFIVEQFGGTPNTKQRSDMGIDGTAADGAPIQVKRQDNVGRNVVDNFKSAVERFDKALLEKNSAAHKPIGYIIAFSFGKGAIEEAARLKNQENRSIRLVPVADIIPIASKPTLTVEINELLQDEDSTRNVSFTAIGTSGAGIEFYSWDFDYDAEKGFKPSVIIDKTGRQRRHLMVGEHTIAVRAVDSNGFETVKIITVNINTVGILVK